jgi:hypothetical protein
VVPAYFPKTVTDSVKIADATYDPGTGTLTVAAASSDALFPPTLTLSLGTSLADLTGGRIVIGGLIAPPPDVRVLSAELGLAQAEVATGLVGAAPAPAGIPVAVNDAFTFPEDGGPQTLVVLANDENAASGAVAISSPPRLGAATVNPDGTVTYTPNPNASGADSFAYEVTANAQVSNTANVAITLTPVNDAPVAVNDARNALLGRPLEIAVLANDTDADGSADLAGVANVTQPADARATVGVSGGIVTFVSSATGTFTFTYRAVDAAGAPSANAATVTVQVSSSESISVARSEYVRSSSRLRVEGSVRPAMSQTFTIAYTSSTGAVLGTAGVVPSDAAGSWSLVTTTALPAGTTGVRITSSNDTVVNRAISFK